MKSLRIILPLVLVITQDISAEGAPAEHNCKTLLSAIKKNDLEKVKKLAPVTDLKDVSICEAMHETLIFAMNNDDDTKKRTLIIEELLRSGAPDHPALWGVVIQANRVDFVKRFIKAGLDVNAEAGKGDYDPLQLASMLGRKEIIEELIKAGVDLNAKNKCNGKTALMETARDPRLFDVAKALLQAGANPNIKATKTVYTDDGETALSLAKKNNNTEIIQLLKEYGATDNPFWHSYFFLRDTTKDLMKRLTTNQAD